ncbi:MAG TPA: histidine phosphatase family protein [Clostridia bacterium]|nr:histidine phosphatase family protein [Clostridia bacterium]
MEILIVRHGQSQADLEDRYEGRADFSLTELGCEQAQKLAKWVLENYRPDIILSSPLKRAAQTAEYIGKETNVKIIFDDELMEWDNGLLAGLLRSEAAEKYPLPKEGRKPYSEFAGTESYINFRARAETFWAKFLDTYGTDENIRRACIVSHGKMINMLFRAFMKLPIDTDITLKTGDTGVHLWVVDGNKREIVFSNSQAHLL